MIPLNFTSNLDLHPGECWPSELPCVPRVGDRIESRTEWGKGFHLTLVVVGISWRYSKLVKGWYATVELHLGPGAGTISYFQRHYAKMRGAA